MMNPANNPDVMSRLIVEYAEIYGPEAILAHLQAWAEREEREGRAEGHEAWEVRYGKLADLMARTREAVAGLPRDY